MPSTWRKATYRAVGGLTEVGFADGPLLLVASQTDRRFRAHSDESSVTHERAQIVQFGVLVRLPLRAAA